MPEMTVTAERGDVRRGPRHYAGAKGDRVDVAERDVDALAARGFSIRKALSDLTVEELRDRARDRDIEGRSTMSKSELVSALTDHQE